MAKSPDAPAEKVASRPVSDPHGAPFIFYESAPIFGYLNGTINLTLSVNRPVINAEGVVVSYEVAAVHLRGNVLAARLLKDSLDKALLLAAPPPEGSEGKAN